VSLGKEEAGKKVGGGLGLVGVGFGVGGRNGPLIRDRKTDAGSRRLFCWSKKRMINSKEGSIWWGDCTQRKTPGRFFCDGIESGLSGSSREGD